MILNIYYWRAGVLGAISEVMDLGIHGPWHINIYQPEAIHGESESGVLPGVYPDVLEEGC
jgi:hypothetical protein